MSDFDSPWKEALELYFRAFMAFFFPQAHREIDWSRGYAILDKELQQVAPGGEQGRRVVDKLVTVWRLNGEEAWVLIHIEVLRAVLQALKSGASPDELRRIWDPRAP